MFFLPLDLLTVLMLVLFVANFIQSLAQHFLSHQPNEGVLVVVSASVGYAMYQVFGKHFNDGYVHFEKLTVSVFGPQYWVVFFVIALGAGAALFALRRA